MTDETPVKKAKFTVMKIRRENAQAKQANPQAKQARRLECIRNPLLTQKRSPMRLFRDDNGTPFASLQPKEPDHKLHQKSIQYSRGMPSIRHVLN